MNLNENYRIVTDENNVTLQFFETREKDKKDGSKETFEFTDNFYYPTIKTALKGFLNKSIKHCETAEEILKKIEEVEDIINNLKIQ